MSVDVSKPVKRLSCLVVARNEEAMLPDCLASLSFADQIVVVLDRTTDGSRAVAEQFDAVVIEGAWESEGARHNLGIESCSGDWILEVDADERATDDVAREVCSVTDASPEGIYLIPIRNHIGGREVRYGWGAYNGAASAPRLFSKGAKIWGPERAHPSLKTGRKLGSLKHGLIHFVDRDVSDMLARMDRYADSMARDAMEHHKVPTLLGSLRRIFSRGFKSYIARQGYREGFYGIMLAYFAAFLPLKIYFRVQALRRQQAPG